MGDFDFFLLEALMVCVHGCVGVCDFPSEGEGTEMKARQREQGGFPQWGQVFGPSLQKSQGWSERQRAGGRHHRTDHHQRGARWVSRPARWLALGTENRNRPGMCSGWRRILFLLMVLTTWIGCVIMGGLFNLPKPPSSYLKWKLRRPHELL